MVRVFVLELLWLFFFLKERNEFPFFDHRCCPDQPPLAPGVPKQVIWCVFYHTCPLFVISATCSSNVRHSLVSPSGFSPSYSATTLAYESITHASTTGKTHAANSGADHAPTCASFPLAHFGRHNITFSLYFDIFQWRVESTSHRRLRCRRCRC